MGERSDYYKEKENNQKRRVKDIQGKLPVYAHPFVQHCMLDYQINTALAYAQDLLVFFQFLKERNPLCRDLEIAAIPESVLEGLTSQDIDEYQDFLKFNDGEYAHDNNIRGLKRKMASLRSFFRYQVDHDLLPADPTLKASKGRRDRGKDIVRLDGDEVGRLMGVVENTALASERSKLISEKTNLRDIAIVTLLLNTGIRVSECAGLDVDDVNFDDNTITIVRKGGKEARLYFGEDVRNTLRDYLKHERPAFAEGIEKASDASALFLSLKRKRMAVRSIEYMIKKFAGHTISGKSVTPHTLRRSYGSMLYLQTGDIRLTSDVLGHKNVETTISAYADITEEHRMRAASVKW